MALAQSTSVSKVRKSILGGVSRKRTRATLLVFSLGLTVAVVASPPPPKAGDLSIHLSAHRSWFQIGKASWYGGKFNGRKTANGERFNMNDLTCAHRSLPLGSWVRVTNLGNQKSAFLRVNDRGPMSQGLIVDLSYAAARKLGINGLGKVRIDKVDPNDAQKAEELVASLPLTEDAGVDSIVAPR